MSSNQRNKVTLVTVAMLLTMIAIATLQDTQPVDKQTICKITIKLKDDSKVTGEPRGLESLKIITDFGTLNVPITRIRSIRNSGNDKSKIFEVKTDVFTVQKCKIGEEKIAIKTKYGELEILLEDIREVSILASSAGSVDSHGLDLARKTAEWFKSQAIEEGGGWAWPVSNREQHLRPSYIAEIGILSLKLYELTGDTGYLDMAGKVGKWFIHKAINERGGYKWLHPDGDIPRGGWSLSCVVADAGEFLIKLYQATEERKWLDYAEGAAEWLIASAVNDGNGSYVPYNTPGQAAHGMSPCREAHTTLFLLKLYKITNKEKHLNLVKKMATWLINHAEKNGDEYHWVHDIPYRNNYPVHGMADVAIFFYELFEAIDDEQYLRYANGALRWLIAQANKDSGSMKWGSFPNQGDYYIYHDSSSRDRYGIIGEAFLKGYEVTKDSEFLDAANAQAKWIISQLDRSENGLRCPYREGQEQFSPFAASAVYRFLRRLIAATGDGAYEETTQGLLRWIEESAKESDRGIYWTTSTTDSNVGYGFGGVAGVAFNILNQ